MHIPGHHIVIPQDLNTAGGHFSHSRNDCTAAGLSSALAIFTNIASHTSEETGHRCSSSLQREGQPVAVW